MSVQTYHIGVTDVEGRTRGSSSFSKLNWSEVKFSNKELISRLGVYGSQQVYLQCYMENIFESLCPVKFSSSVRS